MGSQLDSAHQRCEEASRVTKEEAKDLSPIDIVRYTNQSNDFTAEKKWRYVKYKEEQRKKDDDASTAPSTSSHGDSLATLPAKKSIVGKLRDRIGSPKKKKVAFDLPSPDV